MSQSIKDKINALEKQNRLITENLIEAVWVISTDTLEYEYITPSIREISGYRPEELIGTTIFERLLPASSKKAAAMLADALKHQESGKPMVRSLELELKHKSGGSYWVDVRGKLIDETDGPQKIIGITRDITTRKNAELKLERLNRDLQAALADKERMMKEIKQLQKLLPICSGCRRIRDADGRWWPIEEYIRSHTDADFSHTICKDCKEIYY